MICDSHDRLGAATKARAVPSRLARSCSRRPLEGRLSDVHNILIPARDIDCVETEPVVYSMNFMLLKALCKGSMLIYEYFGCSAADVVGC